MLRLYAKQAFKMLKDAPLVSTISIVGTALAIAVVMVMIMLFQIRIISYKPDIRKNKTLTTGTIRSVPREHIKGQTNNSGVSFRLLEDGFYQMQTPKLVAAYGYLSRVSVATPTKILLSEYRLRPTDVNYWQLIDFEFIEGRSYNREEYQSGLALAVISKELADQLFADQPASGNTLLINHKPYTISGVIKDVPRSSKKAFANIWVPITSNSIYMKTRSEETVGDLVVGFLYTDKENEKSIRQEFTQVIKKFSDNSPNYSVTGEIENHIQAEFGTLWQPTALREYVLEGSLFILFIILLPAINLTGITMNNIRQRSSEIGLRKVFGASKGTLMWQILMENLVITGIGAIIGFAFSFLFVYAGRNFLIAPDTLITPGMLLHPLSFIAIILFCLLMNLLSAGLPAWRMAHSQIIDSLNSNEL